MLFDRLAITLDKQGCSQGESQQPPFQYTCIYMHICRPVLQKETGSVSTMLAIQVCKALKQAIQIALLSTAVKSPNKGQIGSTCFVLYREVFLSEVKNVLAA